MPNATTTGIGATLRSAREVLDVSVEEAAWQTRIRPDYLRALEDERFDVLNGFVRGHLHSYARFLNLDATAIVRAYREAFESEIPSPIERLGEQVVQAKRPPKPRWVTAAIVCALVLIAASIAGIVRGPGPSTRTAADRHALPTLPATGESATGNGAQAPAAVAPAAPTSGVTVVVVATTRSWVRAVVDGTVAFEGTLAEGTSKQFAGTKQIDLVIGNAGAVRLVVDGTDLGAPGPKGQVFRHSFRPQAEGKPQ